MRQALASELVRAAHQINTGVFPSELARFKLPPAPRAGAQHCAETAAAAAVQAVQEAGSRGQEGRCDVADRRPDALWVELPQQGGAAHVQGVVEQLLRDVLPGLGFTSKPGLAPCKGPGGSGSGTEAVMVLSPQRSGPAGTHALNARLQALLNPPEGAAEWAASSGAGAAAPLEFRVGDKVLQLVNDYDRGVFNGDLGVVVAVGGGDGGSGSGRGGWKSKWRKGSGAPAALTVRYAGVDTAVSYSVKQRGEQLVHAYAVTVHKAQGSEYPVVIVPVVEEHSYMLSRNLLYTAVTRARQVS